MIDLEKRASALADRARRPRLGLTALMYHRVGCTTDAEIDVPTDAFRAQVAWLADGGRLVDVGSAVSLATSAPREGLARPIAVTFDDGSADFTDTAFPVLAERNVPVVLFVATGFVDEGRADDKLGRPASWAALADAAATGLLEIGSHGHSHRDFARLGARDATEEVRRSVALIEDRIGASPRHFAYPFAVAPSRDAEPVVRARFASAWLGGMRSNRLGASDAYRLRRSWVHRSDTIEWFIAKADGGFALEGAIHDARVALRRATGRPVG